MNKCHLKLLSILTLLFLNLTAIQFYANASDLSETNPKSITIEKVSGISEDTIRGVDISSIISLENSGVNFYNFDGKNKIFLRPYPNQG